MINESTINGLNEEIFKEIQEIQFSVIGCGGTGAFFAEMLVRTGAVNLVLIDGDKVEAKNLNRTPFVKDDIGKFKVDALNYRLLSINDKANIETKEEHLSFENKENDITTRTRSKVKSSNIAIIAVDNKDIRIECEKICQQGGVDYLVIGVAIDKDVLSDSWACGWNTITPIDEKEEKGYGKNNGSYMSICMEAVAVGFTFMLSCIYERLHNNILDIHNVTIEKTYKNYKNISLKDLP